MNDGIEQLLEVDPLKQSVATKMRWTSFSSSAEAISATRSRRSSGVRTPVTASTTSLGKAFRRPSRTCSRPWPGKRQNTTGFAPFLISGVRASMRAASFGSGLWINSSRGRPKPEGLDPCQNRSRLDIHRVFVVGVLIVDLRLEPVALIGHPVAQRTERRSWRRTDTAHGARVPQNASRRSRSPDPARETTRSG